MKNLRYFLLIVCCTRLACGSELQLSADSATLHGNGANRRNSMICDWDDAGTTVSWQAVLAAGDLEVSVLQSAEAVSAGHEYSVEIAGQTLRGTVRDSGGWLKFIPVTLGKVTIDRPGEVQILLKPVKKGARGLMNIQGITLRGSATTGAKVVAHSSIYPVCRAGIPVRGRSDIEMMATNGSCIQSDIRHFGLLTAESWDRLSWRSAGDYSGFEYAGGHGQYPDKRKPGDWPGYKTRLEILIDGKARTIAPGEITQQLDCRRTTGSSQDLHFQRIDLVLATLQWATAWQCSNTSAKEVEIEFSLSLSDDAGKAKSVESSTPNHLIVKDDYLAHLLSFDRKPVVQCAGGEMKMSWKEKVAPGQSSSVSLGVRPAWSEAHETDRPLRNIGRYFASAQWDALELQVCRQGEWRAAMDLLRLPGTDLNWDGLARIAGAKEKLLQDALPRLSGFPDEWTGAWEYTFDLLRAGTKPAGGLLTDVWLAADPSFYTWAFYWDTAGALHSYSHFRPELAARTMRTYMRGAFLDDGSSVLMIHPVSTHMSAPQLLNIPMALWDCYLVCRDPAILAEAYPMLERHQNWLDNVFNKVKDGTVADIGFNIDYGSELHKERHVWVDMSMFQVHQYDTLAKMAELLDKDATTVANWRAKAAKLKDGINARMWNDQDGAYYALKSRNLEQTKVSCPIELNALIADVASPDQANRLVARFMNPDKYAPGKRGNFFCPSVAFDDPSFRITDGWGGPIWLIEPYYVVRGMARYGFHHEASAIADNLFGMVAAEFRRTGSVWEQYRPDNGQCLNPGRRFFTSGITTSILDMLLRGKFGFERCDEILAFRFTPVTGSETWQGIDNLPLGGPVRLDLRYRKNGAKTACEVKFNGLPAGITRVAIHQVEPGTGAKEAVADLPLDATGRVQATVAVRQGTFLLWQAR